MKLFGNRNDDFVFALKYRPKTLTTLALPKRILSQAKKMIDSGNVPNLLLYGPPGAGKTTLASIIANTLEYSTLYLNCSKNTGIDTIRNEVENFLSTISLDSKRKIFIGDEFERLSVQAQDSLKETIEKFSSNASFIFISNHKEKIIDALDSRTQSINFNFSYKEQKEIKNKFVKIVKAVCKKESIDHEPDAIETLVDNYFPDMRKVLIELQGISQTNNNIIKLSDITLEKKLDVNELFKLMKSLKFNAVREYLEKINIDNFYKMMYDGVCSYVTNETTPEAVIYLAEYEATHKNCVDPRINMVALVTQLMLNCKFKGV